MSEEVLPSDVQQQIIFDDALQNLGGSEGESDRSIEFSLNQIGEIGRPTFPQANKLLDTASRKALSWTEIVGADQVIKVLTPSLDVVRAQAEAADDPKSQDNFLTQASALMAGVMLADTDAYRESLRASLQKGTFGNRGQVLVRTLNALFRVYKQNEGSWTRPEKDCRRLIDALDDLVGMGNPDLLHQIVPNIPLGLLYPQEGIVERFPQTAKFLDGVLRGEDQVAPKRLAEMLLQILGDDEREKFRARICNGEFGDSVDTLCKVLATLLTHKKGDDSDRDFIGKEEVAEELWLDLLDLNRQDPRLRPIRHLAIAHKWYWDEDSASYTLVETLDGLGVAIDEERAFVEQYEDVIMEALKRNLHYSEVWKDLGSGIELTQKKGELAGRLAVILAELRKRARTGSDLYRNFPDELLAASLYTPPRPQNSF